MIVALTVWNGFISPVFDVCREALVMEIDDGEVIETRKIDLASSPPPQKLERLAGLGVETLICGAITEPVHAEAAPRGIDVIGFVAGEVDRVLDAFISGRLPTADMAMPGCCHRRSRGVGRGRCRRRRHQ